MGRAQQDVRSRGPSNRFELRGLHTARVASLAILWTATHPFCPCLSQAARGRPARPASTGAHPPSPAAIGGRSRCGSAPRTALPRPACCRRRLSQGRGLQIRRPPAVRPARALPAPRGRSLPAFRLLMGGDPCGPPQAAACRRLRRRRMQRFECLSSAAQACPRPPATTHPLTGRAAHPGGADHQVSLLRLAVASLVGRRRSCACTEPRLARAPLATRGVPVGAPACCCPSCSPWQPGHAHPGVGRPCMHAPRRRCVAVHPGGSKRAACQGQGPDPVLLPSFPLRRRVGNWEACWHQASRGCGRGSACPPAVRAGRCTPQARAARRPSRPAGPGANKEPSPAGRLRGAGRRGMAHALELHFNFGQRAVGARSAPPRAGTHPWHQPDSPRTSPPPLCRDPAPALGSPVRRSPPARPQPLRPGLQRRSSPLAGGAVAQGARSHVAPADSNTAAGEPGPAPGGEPGGWARVGAPRSRPQGPGSRRSGVPPRRSPLPLPSPPSWRGSPTSPHLGPSTPPALAACTPWPHLPRPAPRPPSASPSPPGAHPRPGTWVKVRSSGRRSQGPLCGREAGPPPSCAPGHDAAYLLQSLGRMPL